MAIRRVQCPGCRSTANVPLGIASVKCPSCGKVWHPGQANGTDHSAADRAINPAAEQGDGRGAIAATGKTALIVGAMVAGMLLAATVGGGWWMLARGNGQPADPPVDARSRPAATRTADSEPVAWVPAESYRVIDLPEATRKRIYSDYRLAAGTTIGKPLPLPNESALRTSVEGMLAATLERELRRFAALHDVTVADILEVIKEGNAKAWR